MLEDLAERSAMVGLQLHYGKTKVLCNKFARECDHHTSLKVQGHTVDVLPEDGTTKYLGRALRLDLHDDAEIRHRINMAWRRFMGLKKELCNKQFPLKKRMQLFGATVSATLPCGAGTWTVTAERLRLLRSAQRKKLRSR